MSRTYTLTVDYPAAAVSTYATAAAAEQAVKVWAWQSLGGDFLQAGTDALAAIRGAHATGSGTVSRFGRTAVLSVDAEPVADDGLTADQRAILAARYAAADVRSGAQRRAEEGSRAGARADTAPSPARGPLSAPQARAYAQGIPSHVKATAAAHSLARRTADTVARDYSSTGAERIAASDAEADARYRSTLARRVHAVLTGSTAGDGFALDRMHPITRCSYVRGIAADARADGYAADIVSAILAQDGTR